MDVYEHIAKSDRTSLHAAIKKLCNGTTRIILTFPTPQFLDHLRKNYPDQIQPVDENIDRNVLEIMALETGTKLVYYQEISVWSENDYAHAVFASRELSEKDVYSMSGTPLHTLSKAERLRMIAEKMGVDAVKPIICNKEPEKLRPYLGQELSDTNIDCYLIRNRILEELIKVLPGLHGTILDIGCGEMPYKPLIAGFNDKISRYVGLDIENPQYQTDTKPDLFWDGKRIPLEDSSVDCAMATELFEHLPDLESVLQEIMRVLKPGGMLFFTVPFLWPLHDSPHDEYRYTPFSLKRIVEQAGFSDADIEAFGGWDASLAQMIGLWLKRRPMEDGRRQEFTELLFLFYQELLKSDKESIPLTFDAMSKQNVMITGLHGTAVKPGIAGQHVECPVCGGIFPSFLPFGAHPRNNAICPSCNSLERHRLLWLFLQAKTNLFSAHLKFLDIAPSNLLSEKIKNLPNIQYLSIDKYASNVMRNMDITALLLPDDYFDCILCYHVLEHIPDDLTAMKELFRVLKPGGWAIIQVPLKAGPTLEGAHIDDPSERKRLFGQEDYIRYYGDDYKQRLESQGFVVHVDSFAQSFSGNALKSYGILANEDIYYCTKPTYTGDYPRASIYNLLLKDKPLFHGSASSGLTTWNTNHNLLKHIENMLIPGMKTLEIGSGYSSVIFIGKGCQHTTITPAGLEIDRIKEYCGTKGISISRFTPIISSSVEALPAIKSTDFDLIFIDGAHRFPFPMVDWFYATNLLKHHGYIIIDDTDIISCFILYKFMEADEHWETVLIQENYAIFKKLAGHNDYKGDWPAQSFSKNKINTAEDLVQIFSQKRDRV